MCEKREGVGEKRLYLSFPSTQTLSCLPNTENSLPCKCAEEIGIGERENKGREK